MSTTDSNAGFQMTQGGILIPFHDRKVDTDVIQTIYGRDLHRELGVKEDYSNWARRQVDRPYFIENRDFWFFAEHRENSGRGRPSTEYYFTVDAAKNIALAANTPQGNRVREYFIAVEKAFWRDQKEALLKQAFLLPLYDKKAEPLYPQILFEELCRVWGFPPPKGSRHSPGCRGIVHRDINGILPEPVQDVLFDQVENPYCADGTTRKERHWRKLVPEQRFNVIRERIDTILQTCLRCDNGERDKYRRDLMTYDRRRGIVIRLSPKVQLRLGASAEPQLWLFDA